MEFFERNILVTFQYFFCKPDLSKLISTSSVSQRLPVEKYSLNGLPWFGVYIFTTASFPNYEYHHDENFANHIREAIIRPVLSKIEVNFG